MARTNKAMTDSISVLRDSLPVSAARIGDPKLTPSA